MAEDTEILDKSEPSVRNLLETEFAKSEIPPASQGADQGSGESGAAESASSGAPSTLETKSETAEETEARKRGNPYKDPATGKFVAKPAESAPDKAAAAETPITAPESKPSAEAAPSTAPTDVPPVSWAADAKAAWADAAPAIKMAAIKREREVSDGFRQYSEQTRRYEQILSPVAQEAQRLGMDVPTAINSLMGAHRALTQNAPAAIAKLAQDYGVEIQITGQASTPPAGNQPAVPSFNDPRLETLWQAQQDQAAKDAAAMDFLVQEFMNDPSHEHFGEIQTELMAMIPAIKGTKPYGSPREWLQEAYDRAVWANPNTRARLSEAQRQKDDTQRVADAKKKADAARYAGSSVVGSTGSPSTPARSTVREEILAAMGGLH